MKLSDVRKMAIRQQIRVHFRLSGGQECVVNQDGIARIPGIRDVPVLNLEAEFAAATELRLESLGVGPGKPAVVRTLSRADLEKLLSATPAAATAPDDHDE